MVPINIRSFPRPAADQSPANYFFGTSVDAPPSTVAPVSAPDSANGTDCGGSGGARGSAMPISRGGEMSSGSGDGRSSANRRE